ncbi:MAG: hypothetical protein J6M30_07645 [Bacteroidales bacterium]|nr:hypothetical protein [Bacteroidales bacterium]
MKKIKFLAVLLIFSVSLPSYCGQAYRLISDSLTQENYCDFVLGARSIVSFIKSQHESTGMQYYKNTAGKIPAGSIATIMYKNLHYVQIGASGVVNFKDCIDGDMFYLETKRASVVNFRDGAVCDVLYLELGQSSVVAVNGKSKIRKLVLDLSNACMVNLKDIAVDTLALVGNGKSSVIKINGTINLMMNCKDYSTMIAGKYIVNDIMEGDGLCKDLRKEVDKFKKAVKP